MIARLWKKLRANLDPQRIAGKLNRLLLSLLALMVANILIVLVSLFVVHARNEELSRLELLEKELSGMDAALSRFHATQNRADVVAAKKSLGNAKPIFHVLPLALLAGTETDRRTGGLELLESFEKQFAAYLLYHDQTSSLEHGMHKVLTDLLESMRRLKAKQANDHLTTIQGILIQSVLGARIIHQEFLLGRNDQNSGSMEDMIGAITSAAAQLRARSKDIDSQIEAYNIGQQAALLGSSYEKLRNYSRKKYSAEKGMTEISAALSARIGSAVNEHRRSISRQVYLIVTSMFFASCAMVLAGLFLGRRFVQSITEPLTSLVHATRSVARGEYEHDLDFGSTDEIGVLAHSFGNMARTVKRQIRDLRENELEIQERTDELERANESLLTAKEATDALNQSLEIKVQERTSELEDAYTKLSEEHKKLNELFIKVEETRNQLLQSEKMASIGQLAAGVAHEINNPLGFVKSNFHTLGEYIDELLRVADAASDSPHAQSVAREVNLTFLRNDIGGLLGETREGLERVRKIVAGLREYSHAGEADWQQSNLLVGLESTVNMAWHEIKHKADIQRELAPLPAVRCIPAQLNQVFMNLLVNAAQAIPERGTISLRSGVEDRNVWIEVEDTGTGMTEEVKRRMFDPFYTTKPVGTGTGLGMSISYEVVNKHGGHFEVTSAPGIGTRIRIILPIDGPPGETHTH